MRAAWRGHTTSVRALLHRHANPDIRNKNGLTALMLASWGGFTETVQALLSRCRNLDAQDSAGGYTALMRVAAAGYADIVRALLQRGANPDLKNSDGATALSLARAQGHTQIVELLTAHGEDNNCRRETCQNNWRCTYFLPL